MAELVWHIVADVRVDVVGSFVRLCGSHRLHCAVAHAFAFPDLPFQASTQSQMGFLLFWAWIVYLLGWRGDDVHREEAVDMRCYDLWQ